MTMKQTRNIRIFFQYVIPSVLSFALSGVYAIVDGFFKVIWGFQPSMSLIQLLA